MKFRIHFEVDNQPDSVIVEGETIGEITRKAEIEINKRGGVNPWSEGMEMTDEPGVKVVDKATGEAADLSVLEDAGVAFDPTAQHLDLTKDEKRRTTALMMAIQAYKELIIRDAMYLEKAADLARRQEGPVIRAATMDAMVHGAIMFDRFIAGHYSGETTEPARGGAADEVAGEESAGQE